MTSLAEGQGLANGRPGRAALLLLAMPVRARATRAAATFAAVAATLATLATVTVLATIVPAWRAGAVTRSGRCGAE